MYILQHILKRNKSTYFIVSGNTKIKLLYSLEKFTWEKFPFPLGFLPRASPLLWRSQARSAGGPARARRRAPAPAA